MTLSITAASRTLGRRVTVLRPDPRLAAVLVVGLALRAVLIPLGHGDDFVVWDKSSAALLHGTNFYAHHPGYPHGPFAYFPLFVYLEVPFQWLALHTGMPFTVLGKLPIAAGDVACALLIADTLRRHGTSRRTAAIGAGLYFLNPLVLYNSAYYGRFDALGCALLLITVRLIAAGTASPRRVAFWYGLAIAAKTFPGFLLPGVLRQVGDRRGRVLFGAGLVVATLSLPFVGTPFAFFHDLVLHDVTKTPTGLSWQYLLNAPLGDHGAKLLSYLLLLVFVGGAVRLRTVADPWWYATLTLALFMLCSKLVLEQYLTWTIPLLIVIGLAARDRAGHICLAVLTAFTAIGVIDNESWHPFGRSSWPIATVFAFTCLALLITGVRVHREADKRRISADRTAAIGGDRDAVPHDLDLSTAQARDTGQLARL